MILTTADFQITPKVGNRTNKDEYIHGNIKSHLPNTTKQVMLARNCITFTFEFDWLLRIVERPHVILRMTMT